MLLLYIHTSPALVYCSGLYRVGRNDLGRIIAIAKNENSVKCFKLCCAPCMYDHAKQSIGYLPFDAHARSFIVALPASFLGNASSAELSRVITTYGCDHVMSLLALKCSVGIAYGGYVGVELSLLDYDFVTWAFFNCEGEHAAKFPTVGAAILDAGSREIAWSKVTLHDSIESCKLKWK